MSALHSPLTLAAFAAQLGTPFAVADLDGVVLNLFEASPLPGTAPDAQHFSLMFRGPAQPALAQATWPLAHPVLGELAIFLVPVGRDEQGRHYQAIFH